MLPDMARWYPLESCDAGLFTSAPHIYRFEKNFAAAPERVWESLASDASLVEWGSAISHLSWLSPRPFGVGTTREVAMAPGLLRVRERFFRWDEGHRHSFEVYEANAPIFRRFAEDYAVAPDGTGTLFTWTVAYEPKSALTLPFKAISPALRVAFGKLASDGAKFFAKQR